MAKKSEHIGTFRGIDTLRKVSLGHQSHSSGTGAWKDQKRDKKARRQEDRRSTKEW